MLLQVLPEGSEKVKAEDLPYTLSSQQIIIHQLNYSRNQFFIKPIGFYIHKASGCVYAEGPIFVKNKNTYLNYSCLDIKHKCKYVNIINIFHRKDFIASYIETIHKKLVDKYVHINGFV